MANELTAGFVHTSDDDGIVMVGFADRQHDARAYVLLQRTRDVDDEDRELGLAGVHVEVDDQRHGGYGVLARFELARGSARLVVRPERVAAFGAGPELTVTFDLDDAGHALLVERLRALFEEEPGTLVIRP